MASGSASRASSPAVSARNTIGIHAARQADWISRRAERIERAAAWNGELGAVSPALVNRFSQRVANRVQRSTRAHQVDAYSGGDNLDSRLDMPLVSNEGSLTPMSDGNASDTPFEFGAFSPEHGQRKPASPQPEAPPAPPPMSAALRERAEQLRRSLATNTPAPSLTPSPNTPAIQPRRMARNFLPATAPSVPAPRVTMQRAKPVSRVEELGTGSAPKPAPATPPVPEPPRPSQTQVQRAPQAPSLRPSPAPATPNVQRTALPPQVVQGQGRLTQMLNARFRPKLDEARNPNTPRAVTSDADDFIADAGAPISNAPAPDISRSVMPQASDDLTPRVPIRRTPMEEASETSVDMPADVPIPTPKPRVLRKPTTTASAAAAPTVQRKADASTSFASQPSGDVPIPTPPSQAPAAPAAPATPKTGNIATPAAAQVQRAPSADDETPRQGDASNAQPNTTPAIQRAADPATVQRHDLPLVAPAQPPTTNAEAVVAPPALGDVSKVQRALQNASAPATGETVQRRDALASTSPQPSAAPAEPNDAAPAELTLLMPQIAPEGDAASAETVQRDIASETPATQMTDKGLVQVDATSPATVQRVVVNAPPVEMPTADAAVTDAAMPWVQRAPAQTAQTESDDGDSPADVIQPSAPTVLTTPSSVQRMAVNAPRADVSDGDGVASDVALPLVQRAPAQTTRTESDESDGEGNVPADVTPSAVPSATPPAQTPPAMQRMTVNAPSVEATVETPSVDAAMPLLQRALAMTDSDAASVPAPVTQPAAPSMQVTPAIQHTAAQPATQRRIGATSNERQSGVIQRTSGATPDVGGVALTLQTPALRDVDVPVVHSRDARSIARNEEWDRGPQPSIDTRDAPAAVQRKAVPKSLQRAAGVVLTDMPVLRAVTHESGESDAAEMRAITMPIVQRAAVKQVRQVAREMQVRPANPYVAAQARAEAMPVVQRLPASETPEVQRAETDVSEPAQSASAGKQAPATNRAISEMELALAAQRILPIIKRLLAVERERLFGR